MLEQEAEPKTIVFVTHDIDEAILLSDRVLFLRGKRIAAAYDVPFMRPRRRRDVFASPAYLSLRQELLDGFYEEDETESACEEASS